MLQFPSVPDGEPVRVSASTFVAYRQCPELADSRLQGEYGPDTVSAFRGGLAHRLFSQHLSRGLIPPDHFDQACREEIGSSSLNHKMASLGLRASDLDRVFDEVRALYERFVKFPTDGFSGSEMELDAEPRPGVQLVGTIDAVFESEGDVRLVDWKTGGLGEAEAQLGFYSLLWFLVHTELPQIVEAVSVRTGERTRSVPTTATVRETAGAVARMVTDLRSSWQERRALHRSGGPWCTACARLETCTEGQAAVRIAAPLGAG